MRRLLPFSALGSVLLLIACSPSQAVTRPGPAPSPPAASATGSFLPYLGAYRTATGTTLVVNGHGHLANLGDGSFRQLFPTRAGDHFTIGPAFEVATPVVAEVVFHRAGGRADQLAESGPAPLLATRLEFKETEVAIPSGDAVLAGTVTEPLTPGPHPGVVIVHGSGPGPRIDYGLWVGLYASFGLTVLAYDKRGNGASTGQYPGENATDRNLDIYAGDAIAAMRFLSSWVAVDPKRLGFYGGSQGGWIVPLAMQRYPQAAFAIIASGPAVTVGQQGVWASFSSSSTVAPTASPEEMKAAVKAEHLGYDPLPALRADSQPILWLNGQADRQVPTEVNTETLLALHKPQFEVVVLPGTDHGLLENPSGLQPDEARASRFGAGLFDKIAAWLARNL